MNDYLIETSDPGPYLTADPAFHAVVVVDANTVNVLHTEDPTLPGDTLIGGWERPGNGSAINLAKYLERRPLGNLPEQIIYDENGDPVDVVPAGRASDDLEMHRFTFPSWAQRNLGDNADPDPVMRHYPAGNAPYQIEMRYKQYNGTWGWRCEVVGGIASRDIASRQMRGTGGGQAFPFTQQDSDWYTDEQGDPVRTWAAENDEGWAEPEALELACRYQGQTEGFWNMTPTSTPAVKLFWADTQAPEPAVFAAKSNINDPWSDDIMSNQEERDAYQRLIDYGFDPNELQVCDVFNSRVTHKQASLNLISCILRGVVTLP